MTSNAWQVMWEVPSGMQSREFDTRREAEGFYSTRAFAGDTDGLLLRVWDDTRGKFTVVKEYAAVGRARPPLDDEVRDVIAQMRRDIRDAPRYDEEE